MTTKIFTALNRTQFVAQFNKKGTNSVIDTNHLSKELIGVLDAQRVPAQALKKLTVLDAAGPTGSGELNEAINAEVARNALEARYAVPGKSAAPLQPRKTDADALSPSAARLPISLKVTGKSQFTWGKENGFDEKQSGHKCFDAALWQTNDFASRAFHKKTPQLNGPDQAIQVAYREDENGRTQVDLTQAQLAHCYIDRALEKGLPVMVGVSYQDSAYNNDLMTDHFVTISGRGTDALGREFYSFKDPGAGGRDGKFLVDQDTGKLFREGPKGNGARPSRHRVVCIATTRSAGPHLSHLVVTLFDEPRAASQKVNDARANCSRASQTAGTRLH